MSSWKPELLSVGDTVVNPAKPEWGVGEVLDELALGDMHLPLGGKITYQRNSLGQRVSVRFSDGRTRTLLTPQTPLKRVQPK